jgi:hypothetical protein|tara:strand:+ start:4744 stop:5001 length:258 start_codon:yes stop_codon:yes gene_type:complete
MASFKALKARLQGKEITSKSTIKKDQNLEEENQNLELEEGRYLLALIAKSDFSGKDIQIVYNVALKLQNIIKSYIKEEENGNNKG